MSIPVHERPEVIENQIQNLGKYLPNAYLILHSSLLAIELRPALKALEKKYPNVLVNDNSYPTHWGWMFHTHILNFKFAERMNLEFEYFIINASNAMMIRTGAEGHLGDKDYYHQQMIVTEKDQDHLTQLKFAYHEDPDFAAMRSGLGIKEVSYSYPEGMSFRRNLFREMVTLIERYYHFSFHECRYAREEIYYSTLSNHLSKSYSNSIIYVGRGTKEEVEHILRTGNSVGPGGRSLTSDAPQFFGIKPVPRDMANPVRQFINSLP